MSDINKTLQADGAQLKYVLLGVNLGGFYEVYTDTQIVKRNLSHLRESFGSPASTLMLATGGAGVVVADNDSSEIRCDALISFETNYTLMMRPADCVPIMLYAPKKQALALVHGARTSLDAGVLEHTVKVLQNHGIATKDLLAHAAPGIGAASYCLPLEIRASLSHQSWRGNLTETPAGLSVDLYGFIAEELVRLGIAREGVTSNQYDTSQDDNYYSHYNATRHGAVNGRNGFACVLIPG